MKFKTVVAATLAVVLSSASALAESVTIEVGYPYSALFDVTFKRMMPLFKKAHPDIEVKFCNTTVGILEAKKAEPNLLVTIWY